MSKKTQAKKIKRESTDHDRVRNDFPIGTPLMFGDNKAIITGHSIMETQQGKALFVNITNVITGDWISLDPFYWGITEQVEEIA